MKRDTGDHYEQCIVQFNSASLIFINYLYEPSVNGFVHTSYIMYKRSRMSENSRTWNFSSLPFVRHVPWVHHIPCCSLMRVTQAMYDREKFAWNLVIWGAWPTRQMGHQTTTVAKQCAHWKKWCLKHFKMEKE